MVSSPVARDEKGARLKKLCEETLSQRRLLLVSNRGPVEYRLAEEARLQARRGSGGVVTALNAVSQYVELTWIASAMGEGDRLAAQRATDGRWRAPFSGHNLYLRFVTSPRNVYHKYYNIFCNPLLWFLQHYMWNSSHTPNIDGKVYDAWENGYMAVNRAFAEAVLTEAGEDDPPPFIMIHDYHLYLVGGYIRQQIPDAILQHFTHIPWPASSYWQLLPLSMRKAIFEGLCAHDIVGFQTSRDVRNFLQSCEEFLEGAEVNYEAHTVRRDGRLTRVRAYPISIDVAGLRKTANSPWVQRYEEKLRPYLGEKTIMRVDRAEPSKNLVRGFRAFNMLLEQHPELLGKVNFLAFLVPSRTHIKQYQRYTQEINDLVEEINTKYGNDDWMPITVFYENNYLQAIAGMRFYDALLVNPVIDGMNLVAKEGPVVNTRDGVLILSEAAGAHEQLRGKVLSVSPADLEGTTQALYAALSMDREEKKRRSDALKQAIEEEDITDWLCRQFEDFKKLAQG